jgi:hypothetical protein
MKLIHRLEDSTKMKQPNEDGQMPDRKPKLSLLVEQDPQSLREKTVAKLREAIIGGYFEPGEQLVERDICAAPACARRSAIWNRKVSLRAARARAFSSKL